MKTRFEKRTVFAHAHIFPRKYRNVQNLPHWHHEHELVFVQSGQASVMYNGDLFTLTEGMCAFLHSGEIHSLRADCGAVLIVAKLDAAHFSKIIGDRRLCSPILTGEYHLEDLFGELFEELKRADAYSGIIADSLAAGLIAHMLRREPSEQDHTDRNGTAEKYKELLELITRGYAYMTFDEAAAFMHFSKPYFSQYFYRHAGMTFTRYLNIIKISFAVEKLLAGHSTVTEVSQSCGFNTIRNFNRVFKELTGYTPNTLPQNYNFVYDLKEYTDSGFDPTLNGTELLEP